MAISAISPVTLFNPIAPVRTIGPVVTREPTALETRRDEDVVDLSDEAKSYLEQRQLEASNRNAERIADAREAAEREAKVNDTRIQQDYIRNQQIQAQEDAQELRDERRQAQIDRQERLSADRRDEIIQQQVIRQQNEASELQARLRNAINAYSVVQPPFEPANDVARFETIRRVQAV